MPKTAKPSGRRPREGARFLADVVAANVRGWRAVRGLKQADVARDMNGFGHPWSQATVSDVENASRNVTVDELLGLAIVLAVSPLDLLDPGGVDGREEAHLDYGFTPLPVSAARAWIWGDLILGIGVGTQMRDVFWTKQNDRKPTLNLAEALGDWVELDKRRREEERARIRETIKRTGRGVSFSVREGSEDE
jgi:transcriptional regulator with XRE-family HTH domain